MSKNKSPLNTAKKPVTKDWHRADSIAAVRKSGTNLQQLSRSKGLGRTVLSNALYAPYPKYERIIADHLGTTPEAIWPSRYNQDGTPRSGRGERGLGRYKAKNKCNSTPAGETRNVYNINMSESGR
jgi:Ner family transcriptional regulator